MGHHIKLILMEDKSNMAVLWVGGGVLKISGDFV